MLRTFSKKNSSRKQNKSGVILITVLFILAVAFIFITAALLMTKATRQRLYTRAETSQARLTVTAVAETFAKAYEERLISDATFDNMVTAGTIGPITTSAPAGGSAVALPGMSDLADNCTMLHVTKSGDEYYFDFTTKIGTESSSVRLTYTERETTATTDSFQHQLRLGTGGRLENVNVGSKIVSTGDGSSTIPITNPNNTVLSLGSASSPHGQMQMCSTLYSSNRLGGGSNWQCYNDVILFGDDAGFDLYGSSGSTFDGEGGHNVYFLNCGSFVWYDGVEMRNQTEFNDNNGSSLTDWLHGFGNAAFVNTPTYFDNNNNFQNVGTIYTDDFSNFNFNMSDDAHIWDSGAGGYHSNWTSKYSSAWSGSAVEAAANSYWSIITTNHYDDPSQSTEPKTYSEFVGSVDGLGTYVSATDPDGCSATTLNLGSLSRDADMNYILPKGTYVLSGTLNISNKKIICDLADPDPRPYVFYIRSDYTIRSGVFEFINGDITDVNSTAYFIICDNARLAILGKGLTGDGINNNAPTGIVSANCYGGPKSNITDYKRANIDQSTKPAVMVIGAGCSDSDRQVANGDGQIFYYGDTTNSCVLNAYVNLLPLKVDTDANALAYGSVYSNSDGSGMNYYGRMYARQIDGGVGTPMVIPYCPAPNDDIDAGPDIDKSKYVLNDFSYFHT